MDTTCLCDLLEQFVLSLDLLPILLSEYVLTYIHCLLTPLVIVMAIFDMFSNAYRANF